MWLIWITYELDNHRFPPIMRLSIFQIRGLGFVGLYFSSNNLSNVSEMQMYMTQNCRRKYLKQTNIAWIIIHWLVAIQGLEWYIHTLLHPWILFYHRTTCLTHTVCRASFTGVGVSTHTRTRFDRRESRSAKYTHNTHTQALYY